MLTIEIINDGTGNNLIANYNYRVLLNGQEIASGRVEKYERTGRWQGLVEALAKQARRDDMLRGIMAAAQYMQERDKETKDISES